MKKTSLPFALLLLLAACTFFAWRQNHLGSVGGAISTPKVLWLNMALASFLVIPLFLWRDLDVAPTSRRFYGWFLAGFVIRAIVEMPMLLLTRSWRCGYGISHDVAMMALVGGISWSARRTSAAGGATQVALRFAPLLLITLACEILNAWLFSRAADPATGTYFASDSAAFHLINTITWIEVVLLYPLLLYWLIGWKIAKTPVLSSYS